MSSYKKTEIAYTDNHMTKITYYLVGQFAIDTSARTSQEFSTDYYFRGIVDVRTLPIFLVAFSKSGEELTISTLSSQSQSGSTQTPSNFLACKDTNTFLWISNQLITISDSNISEQSARFQMEYTTKITPKCICNSVSQARMTNFSFIVGFLQ